MFKFKLGSTVVIAVSGESGDVIGRAEYDTGNLQYLVRYKCADGRAVEQWWDEVALEGQALAISADSIIINGPVTINSASK